MDDSATRKEVPAGLKLALELGPVALFVIAYTQGHRVLPLGPFDGALGEPIFLATAVLMVTTPIAIAVSWFYTRTLPAMPLVTLVVVSVFGALTLWLRDDTFIKMKPTIVNAIFGSVLLAGLAFGRSFLKTVLATTMQLTDEGWTTLTWRWGVFFFFLAGVNEFVWRSFSEEFWVGFKLWGMTGLTFLFVLSQTPVLMRHSLDKQALGRKGE